VTFTNPAFSIFYCVCWPNKWLWAAIYNFFLLCWWCCVLVPMHWWCISVRRNWKAGLTAASPEGRPAKTLRSSHRLRWHCRSGMVVAWCDSAKGFSLSHHFYPGLKIWWFFLSFLSWLSVETLLFCLEGLLFSSGWLVWWSLFLLYSKLKKKKCMIARDLLTIVMPQIPVEYHRITLQYWTIDWQTWSALQCFCIVLFSSKQCVDPWKFKLQR
jgi:hypothetical protein